MKEFWKKVLVRLGVVAVVLAILAAAFGIGIWWVKKQNPQSTVKASTVKAKVVTESLGFYNGKDKVDGTVYRPQDGGKDLPCIIYCQSLAHGDRWCRDLAARGFVTYAFDLGDGEKSRVQAVKTAVNTLRETVSRIRGAYSCSRKGTAVRRPVRRPSTCRTRRPD